jgi:hypothetical protein
MLRQLRGVLMRIFKGLILLSAALVGVAVFYVFGSLVGFWGEIRAGLPARDGSRAQEDGDRRANSFQIVKEKGKMDEPTGKMNPPKKGKKKVRLPQRARSQAASR